MSEQYIPITFPEKCVLGGGGQFANQFMVVNVLSVKNVQHPFIGKENEQIPEATVEERGYDGIRIFSPYLLSYYLYPLADKFKDMPLDTYTSGFDGRVEGKYTKYARKL